MQPKKSICRTAYFKAISFSWFLTKSRRPESSRLYSAALQRSKFRKSMSKTKSTTTKWSAWKSRRTTFCDNIAAAICLFTSDYYQYSPISFKYSNLSSKNTLYYKRNHYYHYYSRVIPSMSFWYVNRLFPPQSLLKIRYKSLFLKKASFYKLINRTKSYSAITSLLLSYCIFLFIPAPYSASLPHFFEIAVFQCLSLIV